MKRLLFAAAMLVVASTLTSAQPAQGATSQPAAAQGAGDMKPALIDLEKGAWEAWKKKDAAYFETFLSADTETAMKAAAILESIQDPACDVLEISESIN